METMRVPTKFGIFVLEVNPRGLCGVRFPGKKTARTSGVRFHTHREYEKAVRIIRKYFDNPRVSFSKLRLDLSSGTPFQKKVYAALMRIPAGKTISYGELARRARCPGAARAVGTAMKKNRLPIVIPCHRVIKGDGSLGRYSQGIPWKRKLLKYEGCGN